MDLLGPPRAVRAAFALWLLAIGAGIFETGLVVVTGQGGAGTAGQVLLRSAAFGAATWVTFRMRAGRRWARTTLTLGLGVLGMLSLVLSPLLWLLDGHSVAEALDGAGTGEWLFLASRCLHVAAVAGAVTAMYRPSAHRFFAERLSTPPSGDRQAW